MTTGTLEVELAYGKVIEVKVDISDKACQRLGGVHHGEQIPRQDEIIAWAVGVGPGTRGEKEVLWCEMSTDGISVVGHKTNLPHYFYSDRHHKKTESG